jgi:hypothetical protein
MSFSSSFLQPEASDCHILRYLTDVNDLTLSKRRKENSLRPVYNYAKQDVKPAHQMSMVMQGHDLAHINCTLFFL